MRKRRLCPWKDFAGNELREGDKIMHPSGENGIIKFYAKSNLKTLYAVLLILSP